jgi:hypothetical protein
MAAGNVEAPRSRISFYAASSWYCLFGPSVINLINYLFIYLFIHVIFT